MQDSYTKNPRNYVLRVAIVLLCVVSVSMPSFGYMGRAFTTRLPQGVRLSQGTRLLRPQGVRFQPTRVVSKRIYLAGRRLERINREMHWRRVTGRVADLGEGLGGLVLGAGAGAVGSLGILSALDFVSVDVKGREVNVKNEVVCATKALDERIKKIETILALPSREAGQHIQQGNNWAVLWKNWPEQTGETGESSQQNRNL